VGRLYDGARKLEGHETTPKRVLALATDAEVVHVVAHGLENAGHPEFSSIVLAPSDEGSDLYAKDVAAAAFRSTRLVFLSSCGTPGRNTHNDPPLTLPESFVAAGVPVVIGSIRAIPDAESADFAVTVHRAYAATGDPVVALRHAQLRSLASPSRRAPRFWASWIAIGGAASRPLREGER
jgi:CHAT domain-containing protein